MASGSADAWRISAAGRPYLLKRMRRAVNDAWLAHATAAMTYERAALEAGVPLPTPIQPAEPFRGYAVLIDDIPYRLYEWVDGREAAPQDDLASWLGSTLAALHAVTPADPPEPWLYGLHPMPAWLSWCEEGASKGLPWAAPLADALGVIEERAAQIRVALAEADDFVLTHRDVEPWNVMVTEHGPLLFDLDGAGADSATLEFNHAALQFALWGREEPDWDVLARTIDAYGRALREVTTPFARRVGIKLARLVAHIVVSLGHRPLLADKAEAATEHAAESLDELPGLLAQLDAWTPRYTELAARTRGMVE